ncbi:MAG: M20/M25/M40 family metallo-hydrolase [Planctomycetota bacterium]
MTRRIALFAVACSASLACHAFADPLEELSLEITEDEIFGSVAWLADDEREGRGLVDDAGLEASADFIADQFERLGLAYLPGEDDYNQTFELPLSMGYDFAHLSVNGDDYVPLSFSQPGSFTGPLAFVGYGVSDDAYDDFADVDIDGHVALMLRYEPFDAEGNSRLSDGGGFSGNAGLNVKVRAAAEAGAVAVLIVNPPMHSRAEGLRSFGVGRPTGEIPAFHISHDVAEQLLADADMPSLGYLQGQIDATFTPQTKTSDVLLSGGWRGRGGDAVVRNIVGMIEGEIADEFVVVGGHYDHLGRGEYGSRTNGGGIHNGADDNASGTAAVMEIAEYFALRAEAGEKPARSIVFALFTAEEIGLVGAREMVRMAGEDELDFVAMVNLDMVGIVRDEKLFVGGAETSLPLPEIAESALNDVGLEIERMQAGGRSDHAPFIQAGIPAMFLFGGITDTYHTPDDDIETLNFEGLTRVAQAAAIMVDRIAETPKEELAFVSQQRRVRLGVALGGEQELSIRGIADDSPAAVAGLQEGDVITALDGRDTPTLASLRMALSNKEPGDTIDVTVDRAGESITVEAAFPAPTTRPG